MTYGTAPICYYDRSGVINNGIQRGPVQTFDQLHEQLFRRIVIIRMDNGRRRMDVARANADDRRRHSDAAQMNLSGVRAARRDEILHFDLIRGSRILHVFHNAAVGEHGRVEDSQQGALADMSERLFVAGHVIGCTAIECKENVRLNEARCRTSTA